MTKVFNFAKNCKNKRPQHKIKPAKWRVEFSGGAYRTGLPIPQKWGRGYPSPLVTIWVRHASQIYFVSNL